jgi:hypothetical protein
VKRPLPFLLTSLLAVASARADTYTVVLQPTTGYRVPCIIGASGSIDSTKGFSGFDYFEWFGITHHRYWFRLAFSPLNPTGGVTNVASFDAATAAVRASPWRQGTGGDVYFDWNDFNAQFGVDQRYIFQRFRELGIVPMMVNTTFTDQDPLADWGNKFKYWKAWYAFVYFFASQYDVTMYEFRNEPSARGSYAQWESHWLVCADAMRKAMADVNQNYGKNLRLWICGPVCQGPYWDYSLPDPEADPHGWGSVAWKKIHTDIYGNEDPSIWNFGMYDYHRYRTDGAVNEAEIATLRQNIATASNAPNATIPLLISEYNTSTGGNFDTKNLDTEDLSYGLATAQILQATATLGPAGLGDEGGFFLFKLGARDGTSFTLGNKTAYVSNRGDYNYGGVTRGGACFQMYARHFRGGKPLLGYNVTSGSHSKRRLVAVLDEQRRAYYLYFGNQSGTAANAVLDLSALEVQTNAPVTVQRVDANNTGQITDYLTVDAAKKVTFSAPDGSAFLVWIPQGGSAANVTSQSPLNDTYLVVGETPTNHGVEATFKVSLHHSLPAERRLGFLQFNLGELTNGNRCLLKVSGRNAGTNQTAREILHIYGRPGGGWTETNLTWATAPGVGKYYTSTNALSATTGLGTMTDIEDNYAGVTKGTGLGLFGKFLGPISFFSADWKTNYVDVTDYVRSLLASNQQSASFIIARIVRYDVNQYSNATYYTKGVYDSDGRLVEIAAKENPTPHLRPALVVFRDAQSAPVLMPIADRRINPGFRLLITSLATDAESPPQVLTFSLLAGPTNAQVDPATGVFQWRPTLAQANTTNLVTLAVSDDGVPPMSATQHFKVMVNPLVRPTLGALQFFGDSIQFSVNGQWGPDYSVFASTNLADWQWLLTTNTPVLPWVFTDLQTTHFKRRFYRVGMGP